MLLAHDPSNEELEILFNLSPSKTVKWIENPQDKSKWFWPAESAFHARIASLVNISEYEKGLAIPTEDHV